MPIITFETVSKEFTPESFGLKEVTFTVEPGEMIFITGHSGSGKTTLMRLLTKEYTPTEGEIFFQDEPLSTISKRSVHKHRRRIGVVFQDYQLVPEMNVWENIALPLYVAGKKEHEIEQRVTDLLNLVKLPEKADQFPSQLSGGEAQRVSIARALAVGPEVIFADEPTGNLDPDTSRSIARLLSKINELGTTILVATHDQDVLKNHEHVRHMVLEQGKLIKDTAVKKSSESKKTDKTEPEEKKKKATNDTKKSDKNPEAEIKESEKPEEAEEKLDEKKEKKSVWGKLFGKKETAESNPEPEVADSKEEVTNKKPSDKK